MYSNNKTSNNFYDNNITVTPIKTDNSTHSLPSNSSLSGTFSSGTTTRPNNQNTVYSRNSMSVPFQQAGNAANTTVMLTTTPAKASATGTIPKTKKSAKNSLPRKPPPTIDTFWPEILNDVRNIQQVDAKHQALPLARIKKIMKLDENAKMIAAEAPLLFAKACEYFIQELTMRAWIHTEENKRRTLQRTDIAQAIANYDQFDFLIDIVPREEIRFQPASQKKEKGHVAPESTATQSTQQQQTSTVSLKTEQSDIVNFGQVVNSIDMLSGTQQQQPQIHAQQLPQVQIIQQPSTMQPQQMQYFITLPGQQNGGQAQIVQQFQLQPHQLTNGLTPQISGLNLVAQQPQQLIITTGPNGQLTATPAAAASVQQQQVLLHNLAQQQQQQQHQQQQQQPQQQIQVLQQVVTPTGEITNVPISINANQLNMLRLQMQQQQQQQQQQQTQPPQVNIFFNAAQAGPTTIAQIPAENQQGQQAIVTTDRNVGATFRPNC